ncbi:MAG TPA: hypothetical protein ENN99_13195 [Chloroflexi bacterium]|nr:hypothetical protein [Chloroflexota bacterium]
MTAGADLYQLQKLDNEGDVKKRRLQEVEAALRESDILKQARQALKSAEAQVHRWSVRQRDLELETRSLADKIARSEQRLYGGAIQNPKELADLQAEVASLRRRRQQLEDNLIEAMIEREEAEATQTQAREHLQEIETHWSTQQTELKAERQELGGTLAQLEGARENLLPRIGADELAVYQNLRRRKGGTVVVQVQDGACGGCGVTVSPSITWQLRQEGLAYCNTCERILVRI